MKKPTDLGMNRTGIQMSPLDTAKLVAEASQTIPSAADTEAFASMRKQYIQEADPIGTVPLPGTVKGAAKSALQKVSGRKPEVFIDKLGQRLAFERTGTRLYEAVLLKCETLGVIDAPDFSLARLRQFRDEELKHFVWVHEAMEQLGADPTSMTPSADVDGVASQGIVQVLSDPRTTVYDCLHALLIAELADNDGWAMLIQLAASLGFEDMADNFRVAKQEEDTHLELIRSWLNHGVIVSEAKAA